MSMSGYEGSSSWPLGGVRHYSGEWLLGYSPGVHIFATLHMPDANPVGLPSIVAMVVVLFLAGVTTGLIPPYGKS